MVEQFAARARGRKTWTGALSDKRSYGDLAQFGDTPAMEFDPLKLMQRLRREIAFATMGTDDNGHVLNNQQVCATAVTACYAANSRALLAAEVTNDQGDFLVIRHRL